MIVRINEYGMLLVFVFMNWDSCTVFNCSPCVQNNCPLESNTQGSAVGLSGDSPGPQGSAVGLRGDLPGPGEQPVPGGGGAGERETETEDTTETETERERENFGFGVWARFVCW